METETSGVVLNYIESDTGCTRGKYCRVDKRRTGGLLMAKIYNLFAEKNHTSLTREQEEIERQYQEYYAEPDEPDEYCLKVGDCSKCGLPIMDYEPLWQINRVSGYRSRMESDSIRCCDHCLLEFIK